MTAAPKIDSGYVTPEPGVDLFFQSAGEGDAAILLVPGWTMSTEVFEHQLSHYAAATDLRCVSFDPRSHGRSSKPGHGHTYWHQGQDIASLIDTLGLNRVVLVGWSFGTLGCLAYVNQYGADHLAGLVMLDGPPRAVGADNQRDWVTYRYDDADGQQAFYTYKRLVDPQTANQEFVEWLLENPTNASRQWLLDMTALTPDSHASQLNATSCFLDYQDDLVGLDGRVPLLYVVRQEQLTVVDEWAREHTPTARVEGFGGHMMFWEHAATFNQIIDEFLVTAGLRA